MIKTNCFRKAVLRHVSPRSWVRVSTAVPSNAGTAALPHACMAAVQRACATCRLLAEHAPYEGQLHHRSRRRLTQPELAISVAPIRGMPWGILNRYRRERPATATDYDSIRQSFGKPQLPGHPTTLTDWDSIRQCFRKSQPPEKPSTWTNWESIRLCFRKSQPPEKPTTLTEWDNTWQTPCGFG